MIDIGIYSILSTHFHVILRNRPDLRNNLTDEQVIRRWRLLYPRKVSKDGAPKPLTKKELKAEVRNKKRVAVLRKRLSDISGMSKSLCEPIAKRANAEATVKGHFFAGLFESIRLLDEEALVACASYVDLNEVRAKLADLPEHARYSSVWYRLDGRQVRRDKKGSIPADAPPILERLGVKPEDWCEVTSQFGDWYRYAAGTAERMNEHAQKIGRRPFKGTRESRRVFGR